MHQSIALSAAFDFFNRRLFARWLPAAPVTLQCRPGAQWAGRFEGGAWAERGGKDVIVLNTATFRHRSDTEILSMLTHEMVHQFQAWYSDPGRGGYHNREWADLMEGAGLMPTASGRLGGRRCGRRMSHYIVAGGRFDLACRELLAGGARVKW
jgi:hypothetical protein